MNLLARSLVVIVEFLGDLALEARHGQCAVREVTAADDRRRFRLGLLVGRRGYL
jgi:hypothetical protein